MADLLKQGHTRIRAVDIKPLDRWYQRFDGVENFGSADLKELSSCRRAAKGAYWIYNLAADMGGMGFIENNKALCMLQRADQHSPFDRRPAKLDVSRFFYASSACVYNDDKQRDPNVTGLKEEDAYPGDAGGRIRMGKVIQRAYVPALPRRFQVVTRVVRYHNVYGPLGTYDGGREKAPAAICRKVSKRSSTATTISRSGAAAANTELHVHRRLSQGYSGHHAKRDDHLADQFGKR